MTWQLALSNFAEKPEAPIPDGVVTKTCPVCNKPFHASNIKRTYCSEHCRSSEKAKREKAQRHARGLKKKAGHYKPMEECVPAYQHLVERKRYWKEVFGA